MSDQGEWRTIRGVHVLIKDGIIQSGPEHLRGRHVDALPPETESHAAKGASGAQGSLFGAGSGGGGTGFLFEPKPAPPAVESHAATTNPVVEPQKELGSIPRPPVTESRAAVYDFGEKIGGARKDTAVPLGPRKAKTSTETDERPAWEKQYQIHQDAKTGKFFVTRGEKGDPQNRHMLDRIYGRGVDYDTREQAQAAIPLLEVSRNHRVWDVTPRHAPQDEAHAAASSKAADEWLQKTAADVEKLKKEHAGLLFNKMLTDRFKKGLAEGKISQEQYDGFRASGKVLNDADYAKAQDVEKQISAVRNRPLVVPSAPSSPTEKEFAIVRKLTDRKMPVVKGGFKSNEEAMRYMAAHPREIIETKFDLPDEIEHLANVQRIGAPKRTGDVSPKDFHEAFGFRGGEFGKWNMGEEGQAALNHAYDGLHDLADTLGVAPKAVSLNGKLAIAFGARGTGGKDAAKAHYEPDKMVINLTKMKGAGSLAHEWFHALDNHLANEMNATKSKYAAPTEFATVGFPQGHNYDPEVTGAVKDLVRTMTSKKIDKPISATHEAKRAAATAKHVSDQLNDLRGALTRDNSQSYNPRLAKRPSATPEQLAEWDKLAEQIKSGDIGEKKWVQGAGFLGRYTHEPIEKLNDLYKKVTGRSFATADRNSAGKQLAYRIENMLDTRKRLAAAEEGMKETKSISTNYYDEARRLDNHRVSDYWSDPHEMAARAFAGYVRDKIEAKEGNKSQYLASGNRNTPLNSVFGKPYPEGEERKAIHAAFDRLFQTNILGSKPKQANLSRFIDLPIFESYAAYA